tara:strand:- start:409 stop:942 length:534 start_codon:yes stop_codon:yes gene_type:complete
MKRLLLLPLLFALTSCSTKELKNELKTEIKNELKIEQNNQMKEYFDREKELQVEIIPDSLLGLKKWESEVTSYGSCSFSGTFKFEIKVPKGFTGLINDHMATYSYKGIDKTADFYATFVNGKQVQGTYISEFASDDDEDYLLVCSINDSEDVKLRSFSENVLLIPGVQPKTIKGDTK